MSEREREREGGKEINRERLGQRNKEILKGSLLIA